MCFKEELKRSGISFQSQVYTPIIYKDTNLGGVFKIDILIENSVIVELKAAETMIPLYKAQLLSYLKITSKPKGLLINFNCEVIKDQISSIVTEDFRNLPA